MASTRRHHSSSFDPPPRALPWAIIQRPFRPYHRVPSIRAVGPGRNLGDTMSTQSPTPRRGRSTQLRAERRLYRRSGTLGQIMPPNPHAAISQGSALGYCSATRGFAPGYRPAALQAARGGTSTRYNHSTTQQFNNSTCLPTALQAATGRTGYPPFIREILSAPTAQRALPRVTLHLRPSTFQIYTYDNLRPSTFQIYTYDKENAAYHLYDCADAPRGQCAIVPALAWD